MNPTDESPNPDDPDDVIPDVQPVPTHSWLQSDEASWPPPPSTPPPPPPAAIPAPPASAAPTPVPALVPDRGYSGYDAPAPDTRWHTYLQRGPLPSQAPARPSIPVAGWLLLAGAALAAVGSFLTWASFPDELQRAGIPGSFNGFTELAGESKDGPFFVAFAAILAAFGITVLLAKRVLAVLIIGMIVAGFGAVAAVIDFLDVANPDAAFRAALDPSPGPGLPVVIAGFVLAFAGSLLGIVMGRRSASA